MLDIDGENAYIELGKQKKNDSNTKEKTIMTFKFKSESTLNTYRERLRQDRADRAQSRIARIRDKATKHGPESIWQELLDLELLG